MVLVGAHAASVDTSQSAAICFSCRIVVFFRSVGAFASRLHHSGAGKSDQELIRYHTESCLDMS